jgi:XTP/dITP diphosphohydrolase
VKIVLATHNRDKAREIVDMLSGLDVEVETLDAYPEFPATIEDGDTLEANALKKAREARAYTGLSALADDTGLEVHALGGAPGVYSARFAGEGATYADNCAKLLREMKDVPAEKRGAHFRTVMVLALAPQDAERIKAEWGERQAIDYLLTDGAIIGEIATEKRGASGFGYDPVFIDGATRRTLAEMTLAEKNRISHRYRALIEMRELMLRLTLARETRSP